MNTLCWWAHILL